MDFPFAADWPARSSNPLTVPWPGQGNPAAIRELSSPSEWLSLISSCDLHPAVPSTVLAKFARAQKLYALGWLEFDAIKAGELAAIIALELAMMDRYGRAVKGKSTREPTFDPLLKHMIKVDGLEVSALPSIRRYGGRSIPLVTIHGVDTAELRQTTLVSIRNNLAHGDPFDGLPWGGLLELVQDLIEYAYRDLIADATETHPAGTKGS